MNVNDLTVQLLVAECKRLEKELEDSNSKISTLEKLTDFYKTCNDVNKNTCTSYNELVGTLLNEFHITTKALKMACEELETHPYSQWNNSDWKQYFLQKARGEEE